MKKHEEKSVTSNIVGVVYTDLVVYIIPGLFFILGASLIFNLLPKIEKIISKANVVSSIVLIIVLPALSYLMGIILSFFRWYLYRPQESFGKLLFGDINSRILKYINLPEPVREYAREKISNDLKRLGWLKNKFNNNSSEPPKENMIALFDCFLYLLINKLRESGAILFSYYDRWTDIDALRHNLIISLQILSGLLAVKICILFSFGILLILIVGLVAALIIFLLIVLNLYVLPKSMYMHMRWILLFYLSEQLKIFED
jgi:hypothetical protein